MVETTVGVAVEDELTVVPFVTTFTVVGVKVTVELNCCETVVSWDSVTLEASVVFVAFKVLFACAANASLMHLSESFGIQLPC